MIVVAAVGRRRAGRETEAGSGSERGRAVDELTQYVESPNTAGSTLEFQSEQRGPRGDVQRLDRRLLNRLTLPHEDIVSIYWAFSKC